MTANLKPLVDSLADTMRRMADIINLRDLLGNRDPGKLIVIDLMKYAMYLSKSDGSIEQTEAYQMAVNFGMGFTPEIIEKTIRDNNIYSKQFVKTVPASMKIFVAVDNAMHRRGNDKDLDKLSCQILYSAFEMIGNSIITADGITDEREKKDAKEYLGMLRDFIKCNLDRGIHIEFS